MNVESLQAENERLKATFQSPERTERLIKLGNKMIEIKRENEALQSKIDRAKELCEKHKNSYWEILDLLK